MVLDREPRHGENGRTRRGAWTCRRQVTPVGAVHLYNVRWTDRGTSDKSKNKKYGVGCRQGARTASRGLSLRMGPKQHPVSSEPPGWFDPGWALGAAVIACHAFAFLRKSDKARTEERTASNTTRHRTCAGADARSPCYCVAEARGSALTLAGQQRRNTIQIKSLGRRTRTC